MKKNYLALTKRIIFIVIIPFLLLCGGVFAALLFNPDISFSVLTQGFSSKSYTSWNTKEIHAKDSIQGQFTANSNNMGILSVRFTTYIRINKDHLLFRIKEKGSSNWYYQNEYKVDQFQPNQLFTFGFPLIHNSKNKTYIYEIESLYGKEGDAVSINPLYPAIEAQYQFPKNELMADKKLLVRFLFDKILNSFSTLGFVYYFSLYILPLIFYAAWIIFDIQFPRNNLLVFILIALMLIDIIFINTISNELILSLLTGFWIIVIFKHRYDSSVSYLIFFFFLCSCVILKLFYPNAIVEKAGVWAFIFLCTYILQNVSELFIKPKKQVDYKKFLIFSLQEARKLLR